MIASRLAMLTALGIAVATPLAAREPAQILAAETQDAAAVALDARGKVWERDGYCSWWLSNADGRSLLASIGQGDETLVLTVADPAFLAWPEAGRPRFELVFDGDYTRPLTVTGWTSHGGSETAMLGMELDSRARRRLGGATRLTVRHDNGDVLNLRFEETPSADELEACVPPPPGPYSDSE